MALPKDLVAASTTPLILSILNIEESYGYAIIQKVKQLSNDKMEWADGMLYPILHRLEKKAGLKLFGVSLKQAEKENTTELAKRENKS